MVGYFMLHYDKLHNTLSLTQSNMYIYKESCLTGNSLPAGFKKCFLSDNI